MGWGPFSSIFFPLFSSRIGVEFENGGTVNFGVGKELAFLFFLFLSFSECGDGWQAHRALPFPLEP